MEVNSALWACYDLARSGRALKSVQPVGDLLFMREARLRRLADFAYHVPQSGVDDVVIDQIRYVRLKPTKNVLSSRHDSRFNGTAQMRVMRLLSDGVPRTVKQAARELGLEEAKTYNTMSLLHEGGAVLRTEKPRVRQAVNWFERKPRAVHLWTVANGDNDPIINGERFVAYTKKNGKSIFQTILDYLRENLCEKATFTTTIREHLQKQLGVPIAQSMIMSALDKHRHGEAYIRGYQGPHRMTPFTAGYAVTWCDPNLPREVALREAKERTDQLLQGEDTTNPLFQRVRSIFDIITDLSLKRDIASQIYIMGELRCTRHQLERALKKTMEFYPAIKRVSIFGDENGNYGYPHYYHERILSQEDLQAAVRAKERYLTEVKTSDERKGHALEGVVWWSLEKFRHAKFLPQKHRTIGMHPYRHTLHLIKPVRKRKKSAEIDGVWESRESGTLCAHEKVTNVVEAKFSLIRKDDLEDFVEVVKWSKEFGADERHGRIIKNGVVLWMSGAAIDKKATIPVGNDYLTVAQYAARLGIKFIPTGEINAQLQKHGWEKGSINAICKIAKDANEAMQILDEIWKHPKRASEILAKYTEQNRSILEQERMLEARMKKARLSKTILDVDESEGEAAEQGNQAAAG